MALVSAAKREILLRIHRHRLRREDLEDAYSQATLELVVLSRRGRAFQSRRHLENALEQRFVSRVTDKRRALSGRSPIAAAIEGAEALSPDEESLELPDTREEPERRVLAREQLASALAHLGELTPDQRLVIATQMVLEVRCEEFCRRHGWSSEKYRKVAQRGRAKLRSLMDGSTAGAELSRSLREGRNSSQGPTYEISPHP